MKTPCVYILASMPNGTLYIGVTANLVQRVWWHRNDFVEGFTKRYRIHSLVWYEVHDTMESAIGRERTLFERYLPLLEILAGQVIHTGDIGSASLIKVISNLLCLVDLVAAGEALMLAKKGGLDLAKCYQAICASSGTSREFEDWAPVILNGSLNTGFTTDPGLKDLGFVVDLGEKYQVPLKLTHLVKSLFEASRDKYGGDAWTPHVVKMLEEEVGDELRAEGFPDVIQSTDGVVTVA